MRVLSNLTDIFSGKNYKRNTLLKPHLLKLLQKSEHYQGPKFIKQWIHCCVIGIYVLLDRLLLENIKLTKEEINAFKKLLSLLNERNTFNLYKLLGAYYLSMFLTNDDNLLVLKNNRLDKTRFEDDILSIFEYNEGDKSNYQQIKLALNLPTGPCMTLYNLIFEKGFGVGPCKDAALLLFFSELTRKSYNDFIDMLAKEMGYE